MTTKQYVISVRKTDPELGMSNLFLEEVHGHRKAFTSYVGRAMVFDDLWIARRTIQLIKNSLSSEEQIDDIAWVADAIVPMELIYTLQAVTEDGEPDEREGSFNPSTHKTPFRGDPVPRHLIVPREEL